MKKLLLHSFQFCFVLFCFVACSKSEEAPGSGTDREITPAQVQSLADKYGLEIEMKEPVSRSSCPDITLDSLERFFERISRDIRNLPDTLRIENVQPDGEPLALSRAAGSKTITFTKNLMSFPGMTAFEYLYLDGTYIVNVSYFLDSRNRLTGATAMSSVAAMGVTEANYNPAPPIVSCVQTMGGEVHYDLQGSFDLKVKSPISVGWDVRLLSGTLQTSGIYNIVSGSTNCMMTMVNQYGAQYIQTVNPIPD